MIVRPSNSGSVCMDMSKGRNAAVSRGLVSVISVSSSAHAIRPVIMITFKATALAPAAAIRMMSRARCMSNGARHLAQDQQVSGRMNVSRFRRATGYTGRPPDTCPDGYACWDHHERATGRPAGS